MIDQRLLDWMLDTDPALRWQVERDLAHEQPPVWQATRARVATEGMGARLLALQDADGQWAAGAYFPAHPDPSIDGQPWTATTWSLTALREWGVDAAVLGDTAERLAAGCTWEHDGSPYWRGEADCCGNALTLANGVWLGADVATLADWFVEHQMDEGGWNCDWEEGATRASFHSTLNAVVGLLAHEVATGGSDELRSARHAGEAYLLHRHLLRRASTGELVGDWATHLSHPTYWRYDVLRAAEHLREAALVDGTQPDPRMAEAIERIQTQRRQDGTWLQGGRAPGEVWFETDVPAGEPSPWITFRATRVLEWWDAARRDGAHA